MPIEKYTKESKNIAGTAYDAETKDLFVDFKSFKDPKVITHYVYRGVPADLWKALKEAESLGGFVNKNLAKGKYAYERLG